MKKINSIFFFLYLLIITGCFAAFARNNYGINILFWSVTGLSAASIIGSLFVFFDKKRKNIHALEFMVLAILFAIVAMRVLLIHFQFAEEIFAGLSLLLCGIYVRHILAIPKIEGIARRTTILYYSSVCLFMIALATNAYFTPLAELAGVIGILLVIAGFISNRKINLISYENKDLTYLKFLGQQSNQAILIIALFITVSIYALANRANLVPEIHSSKMPEGYYELVDQAVENDHEENAKYKLYQEKYDAFMKNRGLSN